MNVNCYNLPRRLVFPPSREHASWPFSQGEEKGRKRKIAMVAVPAASDLLATALAAIGIMYIPASVWQMLRGEGMTRVGYVQSASYSLW